jgi:hypothetical protein
MPETDQQVARNADQFPESVDDKQVVRQHQPKHRKGEERQESKEAAVFRIALHIANAEQMHERGDQRDHDQHHYRHVVELDTDLQAVISPHHPVELHRIGEGRIVSRQHLGEKQIERSCQPAPDGEQADEIPAARQFLPEEDDYRECGKRGEEDV